MRGGNAAICANARDDWPGGIGYNGTVESLPPMQAARSFGWRSRNNVYWEDAASVRRAYRLGKENTNATFGFPSFGDFPELCGNWRFGAAQEGGVSAKLHPWGLFDPGAWKTVRVITETLNEQGQVVGTSTTYSKTTLVDLDNEGVTLEIQSCMEVAGKRFDAETQTVKQGFQGELVGPNLKLKEPTDGEVVIEGRRIPCKVQRLESLAPNAKTVTTLYYSTTLAPYILRRESVTGDAEGKKTSVKVIAIDMPVKVQGETKNGAYVKTVHENANGVVTTLAEVVPEVPGGVVGSSSKEVDKTGRVVRRSTLELIDYNVDPDKDRSGMFGRKRSQRHRAKQTSRYGP